MTKYLYDELIILRNHADAALKVARAVPSEKCTDDVVRGAVLLVTKALPNSPLKKWMEDHG